MSDIVSEISEVLALKPGPHVERLLLDAADEIERLRLAISRLAEQDATLSAQGGNVSVTMDATLTAAEREAVEWCIFRQATPQRIAVTLRRLLERLG